MIHSEDSDEQHAGLRSLQTLSVFAVRWRIASPEGSRVLHIGDSLIFVSGTENGDEQHAASLVELALTLLHLCDCLALPNGSRMRLQMSMHTGEVMSGLVGNMSLKYG